MPKECEVYIRHCDVQVVLASLNLPLLGSVCTPGTVVSIADDDDDAPSRPVILDAENNDDDLCLFPLGRQCNNSLETQSQSSSQPKMGTGTGFEWDFDSDHFSNVPAEAQQSLVPSLKKSASASSLSVSVVALSEARRLTQQQLASLNEHDYKTLGPARMAHVASLASREIMKLAKKNKDLANEKKALKRQLKKKHESLEKVRKIQSDLEQRGLMELTTSGKTGKRLTAASMLALGLRRNFANIAASDFGAIILRDMSAGTVIRAEIRTGTSLVVDMRVFGTFSLDCMTASGVQASVPDRLLLGPPHPLQHRDVSHTDLPWKLCFVALRSDATNSSIWKREKLHVLEAEMGLVTSPVDIQIISCEDTSWLTKKCLLLTLA